MRVNIPGVSVALVMCLIATVVGMSEIPRLTSFALALFCLSFLIFFLSVSTAKKDQGRSEGRD